MKKSNRNPSKKKVKRIAVRKKKKRISLMEKIRIKKEKEHEKKVAAYMKSLNAFRRYLSKAEKEGIPLTSRERSHKDSGHGFPSELPKRNQRFIDMHEKMKLQFELVPGPQSYLNVRNHIGEKGWNTIRFAVYKKSDYKCEICGGIGKRHPVECHEVWSYNMDTLVQRLEYFQSLCPSCHGVKHIGMTEKRGYFDFAIKKFCDVNNVDIETALDILEAVRRQWSIRSEYKWTMDVSHISQYEINPEIFKIDEKKMEIFRLKDQIESIEKILERKKDNPHWIESLKNLKNKLQILQPKSKVLIPQVGLS